MKLTIFAAVFLILLASNALAIGLEITEMDFNVDYDDAYTYRVEKIDRMDSGAVSLTNNSKISADVLPGSNITFTIRAENTFNGQEPDLRGVTVTMTIEEIDDGADLEEKSADFDLQPGDDERSDIKFAIPLNVDAGTYNAIVKAESEDKNGTSYDTEVKLKLEVKKQSHDIRISKVQLNPGIIDCSRKTKLTAEIVNAGSNAENEIAFEFKAPALGINSFDKNIFLESSADASDEEKTHAKSLNIEVPSFFKAGTYPILVNLYWKNFVLFDQKTADLVVKDCSSAAAAKTGAKQEVGKEESVEVIQPKDETNPNETETPKKELITATEEISILNPKIVLPVILGVFVVTLFAVLVVIGYLKRKAL